MGTSARVTPPPPAPGPGYLPLGRLQLRGRCRRQRLTRAAPPRPPPRPRRGGRARSWRGGPRRGGGGLGSARPQPRGYQWSPTPLAGGPRRLPRGSEMPGMGSSGWPGEARIREDSSAAPPPATRGGPVSGKLRGAPGWGHWRAAAALPWPPSHLYLHYLGPPGRRDWERAAPGTPEVGGLRRSTSAPRIIAASGQPNTIPQPREIFRPVATQATVPLHNSLPFFGLENP